MRVQRATDVIMECFLKKIGGPSGTNVMNSDWSVSQYSLVRGEGGVVGVVMVGSIV